MKAIFRYSQKQPINIPVTKQRAYWTAIWLASLACGGQAAAQTNNAAATVGAASGSSTNVTQLAPVTVFGTLDERRQDIVKDLGASVYSIPKEQIEAIPQGENAPFNQLLLRAPGTAEDSLGQVHVRGEHANLQYRINDVLLPEGITGFGPELDTRFVEHLRLITGSLPAQYGFRTAGIVDIQTKSGAFDRGGTASMYGGSYDTLHPSFEYGGSEGRLNYFFNADYIHDNIGIENPTASAHPIHDTTDQYKFFGYSSYLLDDTSRISVILSGSYSDFQIPNTPGIATTPAFPSAPGGPAQPASFDQSILNERQNEQNYYGVAAYQKSVGDLNFQAAVFGRNSSVHFKPDPIGDLFFNGTASDVDRHLYSGGLQADASYNLNDAHTLRAGVQALDEVASADSKNATYFVNGSGQATSLANIPDNTTLHGQFYGIYLQDEWKIHPKFTVNYGARFDVFSSYIDANQLSPRINAIYQPTDKTTLHAGYSRYFTPPPLELVQAGSLAKFAGTANAPLNTQNDLVQVERAHYFDLGVSQKVIEGLQVGLDGYYKIAHNELDDGFFGQTLILSPFNYRTSTIEGVELTVTYTKGGFSTYANVALSDALGKGIDSAQFLFDPAKLAYTQNHYIHLDHDQRITGSFGASYLWKLEHWSTRVFADALYGSGLRTDGTDALGNVIPNGASVGPYYSVSLGVEEAFKVSAKQLLKARIEAVNITDNIYQLRNGAGVGVNAAQYGERFGLFGSLSYTF